MGRLERVEEDGSNLKVWMTSNPSRNVHEENSHESLKVMTDNIEAVGTAGPLESFLSC